MASVDLHAGFATLNLAESSLPAFVEPSNLGTLCVLVEVPWRRLHDKQSATCTTRQNDSHAHYLTKQNKLHDYLCTAFNLGSCSQIMRDVYRN